MDRGGGGPGKNRGEFILKQLILVNKIVHSQNIADNHSKATNKNQPVRMPHNQSKLYDVHVSTVEM